MDLILWRHAQAVDGTPDIERALTPRGEKDAERVGTWLRKRLPDDGVTVVSSTARRTRQTADALELHYETDAGLYHGTSPQGVIERVGWPQRASGTVIVVGHQPWIGEVAALIVGGRADVWPVRKGGLWWLTWRDDGGDGEVLVKAVIAPDLLR